MKPGLSNPDLQPPSKKSSNPNDKKIGSETLVWILSGIIICLILIILAIVLNTSYHPEQKISQQEKKMNMVSNDSDIKNSHQREQIQVKETEKEITEDKPEKSFSEKIQIDWIVKKQLAEDHKMPVWSVEDYQQALLVSEKAKQAKKNKHFEQAEIYYRKAIEILETTLNNKKEKLGILLDGVRKSLEEENNELAIKLITKAQAINPEHEQVKNELYRIEHRNEVLELYAQAIENAQNGNLEKAIEQFEKAQKIEPHYRNIKNKLIVLKEKKSKIDFDNAISGVLSALEINNIVSAEKNLLIAKKLYPLDPVIKELKSRIVEKKKSLAIENLHRKAMSLEGKEQWQAALNSYNTILKYDMDASKAIVNKERAKLYVDINKKLDNIIQKPQRLQNDKILENAKITLVLINAELNKNITILYPIDKTPLLKNKINTTTKILKAASVEIPVTIKSDNETEVVIYNIAKFGKLTEKVILLRPGRYTIVGSRTGYRDYRKILALTASDQSQKVNVICREKI